MNNIEERIKFLKASVALSDLVGPDELTVTVSDLSALIAQLETAQKLISEDGKLQYIRRLEARAEKAEAELSAANERLLVPAGYCIMPESLTAENGAKGALSGEFFTETDITCEECGGDCDEDDSCKHCNDLGVQTVRAAIGWSTIKDIYKMAVGATAIRQAGFTVEGESEICQN
ncbi:hypothetical protein [Yersinia aldovae]|uniref:Uncharacterized protein n=1 Tax=Yersinia aldovae TaxID=29483 RepID=A0ABM9ST90_YERAL|nr:hypothetical protein [Yersinia aldovae]CNL04109.1 Uncharacterised protein [Yersinia aldovae]